LQRQALSKAYFYPAGRGYALTRRQQSDLD